MPGRAIRQEKPRQETVIRRPNPVSSSASSVIRLSFSDFSTTSSNESTPSWTTQDAEVFHVRQRPNTGRVGPEVPIHTDSKCEILGNVPAWRYNLGQQSRITSVHKALNGIREVRFFEDVDPTVASVGHWVKSLGSAGNSIHPEYQHFLNKCETYPQMIWGPVSSSLGLL